SRGAITARHMAAARSMGAAAETSTDMVPPIVTRNKHRQLVRRRRITIPGTGRHHSRRRPASGDGSGTGLILFSPSSGRTLRTVGWPEFGSWGVIINIKFFKKTKQPRPALGVFWRPPNKKWEKLPCRILALDRGGRSDPIARCALYQSTIAERRSGSTTEYGRVLSQPPRGRRGSWRRQSDRSWRRPLGF